MQYSDFQFLKFEWQDHGVLLITINRPEVMNATNARLHWELTKIWTVVHEDSAVRAVVITGAGDKAFSAGGDLDWITEMVGNAEKITNTMQEAADIVYRMLDCDKPIISAIKGVAVGAGLAVALLADVSIMADTARITDGHVRLGVAAGDHAAIIWPLLCGMAKAKYYLMLCEAMSGEEAERIGLVALCVDEDKLVEKAFEVANKLAAGSQSAIRWTKYALNNWLRMMGPTFDSSLALEFMGFAGPDVHDGVASHKEKRRPKFDPDCPI